MTQIALGASVGDTGSLKLDYEYGATAAVNNGNVTKQTITVPGMTYPLIQNYTYDSLNRLDDASETSNGTQTWRQDYSYDRYGNRNFVESNTSFAGFDKLCNSNTELCATLRKQLNPGINSGNNNRMNSGQDYSYDSAGNTLTDANGQTFIYDGENKQVEVRNSSNAAIGKYWYDGDGKRVKKEVPGTGEVTIFVYDAAGKQIAEYSTVVVSANDAKVAYLTADHLGSPRINTDVTGAVTSRHDYHPFGEEMATTQRTSGLGYADDTVRKQFTGYERDGETDLDFAQARMFGSGLGRFTSPDPILSSASLGEPQSWNRYSYVLNNPLVFTDPTGMFIWTKALGGDVEDDDLTQHFTDEANKITDLKKRNKALKKIHKKVINIINRRNQIRAGIEAAKGLLTSDKLSESQKSEISRSINIYGKEGDDNNVIVGQTPDRNGRTMFGEDGRIIVTFGVGNNAQEIAIQFVHEGSHVADDVAFNNGVAGSDISRFATEKRAWTVSAYAAKGFGFQGYPSSLPKNLRVWKEGWSEVDISTAVANRLAGNGYSLTQQKQGDNLSVIKAQNIELVKARNPIWNWY